MICEMVDNSLRPWMDECLEAAQVESPIEALLLHAFVLRGAVPVEPVLYLPPFMVFGRDDDLSLEDFISVAERVSGTVKLFSGNPTVCVFPQVTVDRYRLDFLLVRRSHRPHGIPVMLAVECDGHDFHERTKDQAIRDKQRDRGMLMRGIAMMRFTGSEVWNSPMDCVDQCHAYFAKEFDQELDAQAKAWCQKEVRRGE